MTRAAPAGVRPREEGFRVFRMIWMPVLAMVAARSVDSLYPGPSGFFFSALIELGIAIWLLVLICLLCVASMRQRWRRAGVLAGGLFVSIPLLLAALRSGDYVHLILLYPRYRTALLGQTVGPVTFPWGDAAVTVLDGVRLRMLVYDRSDASMLAARDPIRRDPNSGLNTEIRHLLGNFYVQEVFTP